MTNVKQAQALATETVALVRTWLTEAEAFPVDSSAKQLAGVVKDQAGLAFTVGFVDGVVRPEDLRVAAANLARIAPGVPAFLPWFLRAAVRLGGLLAPVAPRIIIPISRRVLRGMVGHLIIDATDERLGAAISRISRPDVRLNVNLLGEAVLGTKEAARRLDGTRQLLARDDVDYVSIKVSSTVSPTTPWAFDEAVARVVANLTPLFRQAAAFSPAKFINLDMEEYKDLDLTIAVFTQILDQPEFINLEAGIVLQAYLPDALAAMIRLQEFSAARRSRGGAGIKVRIVKGANLPMEQTEAALHDWPLATWHTKEQTDTNYKRVLNYALQPDRIENVRVGVAGHNLFDIAFAWLLAGHRGVQAGIEFEMLLGMAQGQAEAVKRCVGGLLLYTPVVHPQEFDVAIAYLIRRLEEGASQDNFMSAVFELSANEALFEREQQRFLSSLHDLDDTVPAPHRVQDRTRPTNPASRGPFENAPDTDPSVSANRAWGRLILGRVATSTAGHAAVAAASVSTEAEVDDLLTSAADAAGSWGALTGAQRGAILDRAGDELENRRAELLEVMAAEAGKTLDQADPEVSEAIDFARYYARQAVALDDVDGAVFVPKRLTLVTPPWNFPVAIPAGSTLAALAAGSAVVVKPARQARFCGAVLVEALWAAGVPRDVLRLVQLADSALGAHLVAHPLVDQVILTGGYETAELFRSFRADLPLFAETSGKNAIIVTPSADLDLAIKDVVSSAFGHAGQKCSAASLVILVGSVATSRRFTSQLVDAVQSLVIGYPTEPATQMGPLIEPASGKLLDGLTTLGAGERWLIEPRQLDASGRLWSPGVRAGVRAGSRFHLTEFFGPILGVMTAATLEEAIALQNQVDYGLTSGLHSLNPEEMALWLGSIQAGNLYINRGITGAIVQRQPFGGWKKSAVGTGHKAGGPNYLVNLGGWLSHESASVAAVTDVRVTGLLAATRASVSNADAAFLERSFSSDAAAWASEFGVARDVSALGVERNIFRYVARAVTVRLSAAQSLAPLVRVVGAGLISGATLEVSSALAVPQPLRDALTNDGVSIFVEADAEWLARASTVPAAHIRLIGGDPSALAQATNGRPDVAVHFEPVTESGRLELLPFVKEQAVSITAHRFGTPNHLSDGLI